MKKFLLGTVTGIALGVLGVLISGFVVCEIAETIAVPDGADSQDTAGPDDFAD